MTDEGMTRRLVLLAILLVVLIGVSELFNGQCVRSASTMSDSEDQPDVDRSKSQDISNGVAENLAPNPSFENGETSPLEWSYYDYHDGTLYLWNNISSHTGSYSVGIANVSQPNNVYVWFTNKTIPVDSTKSYIFSVWYKWIGAPVSQQDAEISVSEYNENGTDIGGFGLVLNYYGDGDWHHGLLSCPSFNSSTVSVTLQFEHVYRQTVSDAYVRYDDVFFGQTRVHNLNTGLNYTSIQEAIDASETSNGHTIFVEEGIYYEHVVVNKSLSLIGENSSNTVIDGGRIGKVVTITANNTKISGFKIQRAGFTPWGSDSGVYLESSNNVITDNIVTNNDDWGIWLNSSSSNNTITNNNITDNWRGCMLMNTSDNNLVGNNITNHGQDGICLWNSFNNTIFGNTILDNVHGIELDSSYSNNVTGNNITSNLYGVSLFSSSNNTLRNNALNKNLYGLEVSGFLYLGNQLSYFIQDIDASNTVNGKPICYWVNHNNEQVALDAGYIALVNCTNITIKNLNLKNNVQGMVFACTNNSRIQNLNITNSGHGIYLYRSCNNIICDSNLSNNQVGISLESSVKNNIVCNNITKATEGILLSNSSNNNITNNNIANNEYRGVFVGLSSENKIAYNNIIDNKMAGIGISSDGKGTLENNFIHSNNLINNTCGVQLGDTSGNKCYYNNFINNTEQASVHVSIGSVSYGNIWDNGYPSGGNYWSNYTGVDFQSGVFQNETLSDGIGDAPYFIDENNQDNYPLFGMFSDFNATLEYHVQTICNSSISDFQFNGASIHFNITGENGTAAFCRICIPTALMNETYKVFVNGTEVPHTLLPCSNSTHSYLYFNYTHSTQEVIIVPEFPSLFILPLFMIATLLAAIVYRKKTHWHQIEYSSIGLIC